MSIRRWVYIFFGTGEAHWAHEKAVVEIIKEDTGSERVIPVNGWIYGAHLTEEAIKELRELDGVILGTGL